MSEFLFKVFPYIAFFIAIFVGFYRYFQNRFSYSSLSSQFIEKRVLFWGSVPFHYGIIIILSAHIIAALFPALWSRLLGNPLRLYFLEVTGYALGIFTIFGICTIILRRFLNPSVRSVTSIFDWFLLLALLFQVFTGTYIAITYRWGGLWYLHTAVPWLESLVKLKPDISTIENLPALARIHFFSAFLIIGLFPFTRLVHIFTVPLGYLWRPYQLVIWNASLKEAVKRG